MTNLRILIVEDESICAKDIQIMLNRLGYSVSGIASKGKEAIEKTRETHPDLILMDIKLKGDMDGIETAERIRELLSIPIIFMSALTDEASLNRTRKIKPSFFIPKPIGINELKATVEKAYSIHNIQSKASHHT